MRNREWEREENNRKRWGRELTREGEQWDSEREGVIKSRQELERLACSVWQVNAIMSTSRWVSGKIRHFRFMPSRMARRGSRRCAYKTQIYATAIVKKIDVKQKLRIQIDWTFWTLHTKSRQNVNCTKMNEMLYNLFIFWWT